MTKGGWVYILASRRNGTLYTGVTSDLAHRVWQHREGLVPGFTATYGVKALVWYEHHASIDEAITREKRLKEWQRAWKLRLIEEANPGWRGLSRARRSDQGTTAPPAAQPRPSRAKSKDASPLHRHPGAGRDPEGRQELSRPSPSSAYKAG